MPPESILEVIDRRLRASPTGVTLYEHEVGKLAEALRGMTKDLQSASRIEDDIRSGFFRYRGYPVRVNGSRCWPTTALDALGRPGNVG